MSRAVPGIRRSKKGCSCEINRTIRPITRRHFLGHMVTGLSLLAGGCAKKYTLPIRGSDKGSLRLVFYTDVHARLEWNTPAAMEKAAHAINACNADLVIAGGDLITEGFASSVARSAPRWDAYMRMHRSIEAELYPAIGNHDLVGANPSDGAEASSNPRAVFLSRMGLKQTYYSFDAVGYHFAILDAIQITGDEYAYQGFIEPEQMAWLKADLDRVPQGAPIILITHIPLLTAFYSATEGATAAAPRNRVVVNSRDVFKVVEKHNVIMVLQGHLHVEEMIRWQGTAFIGGGAVCGRWWGGPRHGTEEGFSVITLTGNRIHHEYIDYGWTARRP